MAETKGVLEKAIKYPKDVSQMQEARLSESLLSLDSGNT